jgi:16S rRNA processing protein RimM
MKDHVLIAVFGAPHGVKGEVRVKSFAGDPADFDAYGPLVDARGRRYEIASKRHLKDDMFVARVKGCDDRTGAQGLTHVELFVPRARLPEAEEGEFYVADLIGLDAVDEAGAVVGKVAGVENYGAGDILEIAPLGGGETALIPFREPFAGEIDLMGRRIVVRLPELSEDDEGDDAQG